MSKTKKIISVILALTLIMTMATVAIVSASAADQMIVQFSDNQGWGGVYVHYWGSADGETTWPGMAMTALGDDGYGNTNYEASIPADVAGVVFTAGESGPQTSDIVPTANTGYYPETQVDGKWECGTWALETQNPVVTDPIVTEPAATEPAATEPAATEPVATEPAATEPAATEPAATEPAATEPAATEPAADITVFNPDAADVKAGDTFTYTADITAAVLFEDIQAYVEYDADKFELVRADVDPADEGFEYCPNLGDVVLNADKAGIVKFNSIKLRGFDFTEGLNLITLEFKAIADANVEDIDLVIEEMTFKGDTGSYFTSGKQVTTEGIAVKVATTAAPIPSGPAVTDPIVTEPIVTEPEEKGVTVNGVTKEIPVGKTFTYKYDLQANELFEDIQATVYYDSTALKLIRQEPIDEEPFICCPNLGDVVFNADKEGVVKFNSIKLRGFDFTEKQNLITLEFEVIDDKANEVYLVIEEMTVKGNEESYFTGSEQVKFEGIALDEYMIYDGPIVTEPIVTEPIVTEPIVTEPIVTEPIVTEPIVTEPIVTEPIVTEPIVTEPIVTEPIVTEPIVTEPIVTEPIVTEPIVTEPIVTEPIVTEPIVTEPIVTEPIVTEPIVTEPIVTEPIVTEPIVTEPATTVPGATDATSATGTTDTDADVPTTGGVATYIYVVFAVLALAACAVVVLRKKAND